MVCNEGWFDDILFYSLSIYTFIGTFIYTFIYTFTPGVKSIAFMLLEKHIVLLLLLNVNDSLIDWM